MYLHYATLIAESAEELVRLERVHRTSPVAERLRMLRLLKTGAARSRRALSHLIGYSERQLQRWFDTYREGGLDALLIYEMPSGASERITAEAWTALEGEMKAGRVARLRDAQCFLEERFRIPYSIGGLSDLFQRHKTKLKTGRRRNRRASAEEQEAFKKTVPG